MPGGLILLDIPNLPNAATFRAIVKTVSNLGLSAHNSRHNSLATTTTTTVSEAPVSRPTTLQLKPTESQQQVIHNVLKHIERLLCDTEVHEESSFRGSKQPEISLETYLERLVKYSNTFSQDQPGPGSSGVRAMLIALELIERSELPVTRYTVHRLFLVGFLTAIKSCEDFPVSHKFWAQVGGVSIADLNAMERDFCVELKFTVHVSLKQYQALQREFGAFASIEV